MKRYRYSLSNLDCANCARKIEERLQKENELKNVVVNFSTLTLSFESDKTGDVIFYIQSIIDEVEEGVKVSDGTKNVEENGRINFRLIRLLIGIVLALIGFFVKLPFGFNEVLVVGAYGVLLYRTFLTAIKLLFKSKTINENLLITISCIGAYLVGEHMEGLMVIILYEIGKILEEKAVNNSRKSIANLIDIKPTYVCLEDGKIVDPESVHIGDIIVVKVGEIIPLDGEVIEGESHLDTSSLTGESKLVGVSPGVNVLSGSVNMDSILKVRVTSDYSNSTVSRILDLVSSATDKKARTETFVSKASRIYTPIVLGLAILVAVLLPVVSDLSIYKSIYRALIFLVISCPCSIAISVPLSYFSGIGRASRDGILIKGSNYLDILKDVREVIFDKTGTLTTGEFGVTDVEVIDSKYKEEDVLKYVVLGESNSLHPIAKSILKYYGKDIDSSDITNYKEVKGSGITYKMGKDKVKIGSKKFINCDLELKSGTNVFVSINDKVIGRLVLNDIVKSDTEMAIECLIKRGIKVRMFTGDNQVAALDLGNSLGIKDVTYEMLPDDKYNELIKIRDSYQGNGKVAFVGDGVNDSPVLAVSDVGISMGGIGTGAAIEASDVVIMTDSLLKIDRAIAISEKTYRIIIENLIFAIGTKVIILVLSVIGIGGMWQAVFADVGVTLITILNTLRILRK